MVYNIRFPYHYCVFQVLFRSPVDKVTRNNFAPVLENKVKKSDVTELQKQKPFRKVTHKKLIECAHN